MSTIQDRFNVRGMDCTIETTDGGVAESRATLYVTADNHVVTDASGYCSPIYAAYTGRNAWRFSGLHGAARTSMIRKILREAVDREIDAHIAFCWQQIEDGEIDINTGEQV